MEDKDLIAADIEYMGFVRLSDFVDNSCGAPVTSGVVMRFFSPHTDEVLQLSISNISDTAMVSDDVRDEVVERFGRKD